MINTKIIKSIKTGKNTYSIVIEAADKVRAEQFTFNFTEDNMSEVRSHSHAIFYSAMAHNKFKELK